MKNTVKRIVRTLKDISQSGKVKGRTERIYGRRIKPKNTPETAKNRRSNDIEWVG